MCGVRRSVCDTCGFRGKPFQPKLCFFRVSHFLRSSSPTLGRECPESADFDTYTSDFDTQGIYSLSEISKRDNAGASKLPERGIAGASELPKRLNDQKGWKRLQDLLAVESAGWSASR